jgi:hypothetical protein
MRYLGWIIALVTIVFAVYLYQSKYVPLKTSINKLEQEIAMWEEVLKGEKGISGDRNSITGALRFTYQRRTR